ncbi:MAG: hypothetical protein Q8R26_03275 [bacterium]|nr:hypothetical protein [bacterium]
MKRFITATTLLIIPLIALGAGLIPCSGLDCNLCHFLTLIKNVITWVTEIAAVLAVVFIIWGAFDIMLAGASAEKVSSGKTRMLTAIIGVVIMLSAYLIIGTVLNILTDSPSRIPWTQIQCSV